MNVLVTGGAGYIGAHVVRRLVGDGIVTVVVDDLSTGLAQRVPGVPLHVLDLADPGSVGTLTDLLRDARIDAVVHLAARKRVDESLERPLWYYGQNVGGLVALLEAMHAADVRRLVFSSSAAVYGDTVAEDVDEDAPTVPLNPYGRTKLVGEWLCADAARAHGLRAVSLRYFNVAGAAAPDLGDTAALNLVPIVLGRLAAGQQPVVLGADYPTPDGTCVRDYVHVEDLAGAHVAALARTVGAGGHHEVLNVGTGTGHSVLEVVREAVRVTGSHLEPLVVPRRAGDPARVVAAGGRAARVLGWRAERTLADIVESEWAATGARANG